MSRKRVLGHIERDPKLGTDRLTSAILEFFQGTATFTVSTQLTPYQRTNIFGTAGRIEVEIPVNAPNDRPTRLWVQTGTPPAVQIEEVTFDTCDMYTIQADAFARAILDDTPVPTPIADAVANMRSHRTHPHQRRHQRLDIAAARRPPRKRRYDVNDVSPPNSKRRSQSQDNSAIRRPPALPLRAAARYDRTMPRRSRTANLRQS